MDITKFRGKVDVLYLTNLTDGIGCKVDNIILTEKLGEVITLDQYSALLPSINNSFGSGICELIDPNLKFIKKEPKFTIDEIRTYLFSKNSMGDILYFLSAENIIKANEIEEIFEEE